MFVLNFFINGFRSVGRAILYPCRGSSRPSDPLVGSSDSNNGYSAVDDPGDIETAPSLTDDYVGWGQTHGALRLCLIHITLYLLLAIVGYSLLLERWPVTDSIYCAVVIFTTVGYGDYSPSNNWSRVYTVALAFYGIVILGLFLGIMGEYLVQQHESSLQTRMANVRTKVMEQFSERDTSLPRPTRSFLSDLVAISLAELPIIAVLVVMALPIMYLEGWDVVKGVYWMFITGSTVGFGDLSPTTGISRKLCILYIPISVAVTGEFLGRVASAYIDRRNDTQDEEFMKRSMTLGDLDRMDTSRDGKVSPEEFLTYMLVALQKVDQEDIDEIMTLFAHLDVDNSGYIEKKDLQGRYQFSHGSSGGEAVPGPSSTTRRRSE